MKHIGLTPARPLSARHLARPHKPPAGVTIPTRATLRARNRTQARGILALALTLAGALILACIIPGGARSPGDSGT